MWFCKIYHIFHNDLFSLQNWMINYMEQKHINPFIMIISVNTFLMFCAPRIIGPLVSWEWTSMSIISALSWGGLTSMITWLSLAFCLSTDHVLLGIVVNVGIVDVEICWLSVEPVFFLFSLDFFRWHNDSIQQEPAGCIATQQGYREQVKSGCMLVSTVVGQPSELCPKSPIHFSL